MESFIEIISSQYGSVQLVSSEGLMIPQSRLFYGAHGADCFEFEWQRGPSAVSKRYRGTTGWAPPRPRVSQVRWPWAW